MRSSAGMHRWARSLVVMRYQCSEDVKYCSLFSCHEFVSLRGSTVLNSGGYVSNFDQTRALSKRRLRLQAGAGVGLTRYRAWSGEFCHVEG
jgi:hypothetical protein